MRQSDTRLYWPILYLSNGSDLRCQFASQLKPCWAMFQAEVRLAELAEERQGAAAAREAAEAAHEAAVEAATIRGEPLGCDRADRHYWWFPGEQTFGSVSIKDGWA